MNTISIKSLLSMKDSRCMVNNSSETLGRHFYTGAVPKLLLAKKKKKNLQHRSLIHLSKKIVIVIMVFNYLLFRQKMIQSIQIFVG